MCTCILSSNYTTVNIPNKSLHFGANIQKHLLHTCLYYLIVLISLSHFTSNFKDLPLWSNSHVFFFTFILFQQDFIWGGNETFAERQLLRLISRLLASHKRVSFFLCKMNCVKFYQREVMPLFPQELEKNQYAKTWSNKNLINVANNFINITDMIAFAVYILTANWHVWMLTSHKYGAIGRAQLSSGGDLYSLWTFCGLWWDRAAPKTRQHWKFENNKTKLGCIQPLICLLVQKQIVYFILFPRKKKSSNHGIKILSLSLSLQMKTQRHL